MAASRALTAVGDLVQSNKQGRGLCEGDSKIQFNSTKVKFGLWGRLLPTCQRYNLGEIDLAMVAGDRDQAHLPEWITMLTLIS